MFKILLILFFPSLLFAQPTSSSFLEPLQKNRLSTTKLRINDTLSQAALLHARWLSSEENRRGHIEEDPKTKTVSDRVKIFNKRLTAGLLKLPIILNNILEKLFDKFFKLKNKSVVIKVRVALW
jgi:hypothetical protein